MEGFLDGNEDQVKSFLEDHKHEVTVLSMPKWVQENGKVQKEVFSQNSFRGQSLFEAMVDQAASQSSWMPILETVPVTGMKNGMKFSWPSTKQLQELPLDQPVKLNGFGYNASKELNEL